MSASTPAASSARDNPAVETALLQTRHPRLLTAAVMGVSICHFLDLTIANVALPHMRASLGASPDSITWVLTSFIIAGAMVLPLTGWLSDRLGSRNLFIGGTILFVVASMLCGAATSLEQMVAFRALQGAAAAGLAPLAQTIMFDINPPHKQTKAMSVYGMAVMIAPVAGPFLGGFLTETLSWRWVFYINLPIGLPAIAILLWLLPSRPIVSRRLDVFGAGMLALALGALQLSLDRGQHLDWFQSYEIVIEMLVATSAFWIFFFHSRTVAHPLFNPKMVSDPNFLIGVVAMVVIGVANISLAAVLPTMYQSLYGYDVMETGKLMAPRGIGVLVSMMITSRLIGKVDDRVLISAGFALGAFSLWLMTHWSLDMGRDMIVVTSFIQGLGIGMTFVPVTMMAFGTLLPQHRPDGSTLLTLVRNVGSSIGISMIVTVLARNVQTSHSDIAANVTSFSLPTVDPSSAASMLDPLGGAVMAALEAEVTRQATMIAYLDNFYMLFWVMLAFVPLVWIAKRPSRRAA